MKTMREWIDTIQQIVEFADEEGKYGDDHSRDPITVIKNFARDRGYSMKDINPSIINPNDVDPGTTIESAFRLIKGKHNIEIRIVHSVDDPKTKMVNWFDNQGQSGNDDLTRPEDVSVFLNTMEDIIK